MLLKWVYRAFPKGVIPIDRLNKLLKQVKENRPLYNLDYDFSKLTTSELKEIIAGMETKTITEQRLNELLEPIKFNKLER